MRFGSHPHTAGPAQLGRSHCCSDILQGGALQQLQIGALIISGLLNSGGLFLAFSSQQSTFSREFSETNTAQWPLVFIQCIFHHPRQSLTPSTWCCSVLCRHTLGTSELEPALLSHCLVPHSHKLSSGASITTYSSALCRDRSAQGPAVSTVGCAGSWLLLLAQHGGSCSMLAAPGLCAAPCENKEAPGLGFTRVLLTSPKMLSFPNRMRFLK